MSSRSIHTLEAEGTHERAVLQYVVDHVPALIFWKDREGVYLGCNKSFAALDGCEPHQLAGKTDYDTAWRVLADSYRAGDRDVMEGGVPVLNTEEISPDGKGGEMVILTSKVPMRDEAGNVTGILGIIFDITARKRMEIELQQAKAAAEEAVRARSNFIANVSHELRTPLTLILGPVKDALADASITGSARDVLERVQRNGFRLYNLVNDVLDFAKADAKQIECRPERVDVVAASEALIEDLQPLARGRGLALAMTSSQPELPVSLDPKLYERILLNLVGNALKFTPAGGRVDVRLTAEDEVLGLEVADTGIGIPERALGTLFAPFSQVDSSATRKHQGTGLGLTLVEQLAEAMGGGVTVESEVGRGSTFAVRLPAPAKAAAEGAAATEAPELGGAAWQRRIASSAAVEDPIAASPGDARPRVLIADDDDDMRAYVASTLATEFAVVAVENGVRAWELLQQHAFDVVVSDAMMPELDGIELAKRIKAERLLGHLPVILVTARGGIDSAVDGLDVADDYVVKPFVSDELRARVRAAVRTSRLQRELRLRARDAGMAQVATGVLHNVGNVLNSVSVSSDMLVKLVDRSRVDLLEKVSSLIAGKDEAALASFLTSNPQGRRIPQSLVAITAQLVKERAELRGELAALRTHLTHLARIVASQQELAHKADDRSLVEVTEVVDQSIVLAGAECEAAGIRVERELADLPAVSVDPHKLIQILVNLLSNAKHALLDSPTTPKVMSIATRLVDPATVAIAISDNGVGIPAENMPRIFEHGFTTKRDGHGFGLHISAITASELGGSLAAHSAGHGAGATFTLTVPLRAASR